MNTMTWLWLLILLFLTIFLHILLKHRVKCSWWKRQNVDLISIWQFYKLSRGLQLYEIIGKIYCEMCVEQKSCKAIESVLNSTLILRDQRAIKEVLTSQFENFPDRGFYVNPRDPLLFNLARFHYDLWKPLRAKLTAAPTMAQVGHQMVQVLAKQISEVDPVVEMHDLCKRFAVDVIGNVAFGIDCNCLKNPEAEFKRQGEKTVRQHFRPFTDQFAEKYSRFMKFINFKYHSKESINFFTNVVKETLEYREKHQIKRNDFLNLLMEFRDSEDVKESGAGSPLSFEMMVGQVFLFFVGGYESNASALSQALYELAKNPAIQEKAREEIHRVQTQNANEITYESLKDMKYTKQIVYEILRKYPIVHTLVRFCRNSCTLNTNGGSLSIPKDTNVFIPTYGIHYNPEFYPNPHEFCPERFDEREVSKRPPYTFLTFGDGPRNCLAAPFGLLELQFALTELLSEFRFSITDKTPKKIEFDKNVQYNLCITNGIYLKVEKL